MNGTKAGFDGFGVDGEKAFTYLGHARDLLTIKTPDAPEPTGAELVGKVCEFSDDGKMWTLTNRCTAHQWFARGDNHKYEDEDGDEWLHARLYREDRP